MYPREYFDTFWRAEIKDDVFVAMSFDSSLADIWDEILLPAISQNHLNARRVDATKISDDVVTEIMEGIAHSRLIVGELTSLFESTDNTGRRAPNPNVMYEIGLAHALRAPCEVILLRSDESILPFDLSTIRVRKYDRNNKSRAVAEIGELIAAALAESKAVKGLKLENAHAALDLGCITIIKEFGRFDQFGIGMREKLVKANVKAAGYDETMGRLLAKVTEDHERLLLRDNEASIGRLLDLAIIRCDARMENNSFAYHWTPFGKTLLRFMKVRD